MMDPTIFAERRVGRFSISRELIVLNPAAVAGLFADVIVVRCEYMFSTGCLEYIGYSPSFDPVPAGQEAPWYNVIAETDIVEGRPVTRYKQLVRSKTRDLA